MINHEFGHRITIKDNNAIRESYADFDLDEQDLIKAEFGKNSLADNGAELMADIYAAYRKQKKNPDLNFNFYLNSEDLIDWFNNFSIIEIE